MDIKTIIRDNRPNVSDSTVKTYEILIRKLFYRHNPKSTPLYLDWYGNEDLILNDVEKHPLSSQKTILSALIALYPSSQKYRDTLLKKGKRYQENVDKQQKTETQSANWIQFNEVKKIYNTLYNQLKSTLNSTDEISQTDFMHLQDLVLLAVTTGMWIAPRRSSDWVNMKVRNFNKETDNYMDKNEFGFNIYKTAKTYGKQTITIPRQLKTVISKYMNHNPYDYLFVNIMGLPITNVDITRRLNHIFGRKISTSMLRHIYLTDKMGNIPKLVDMKQTAHDMGHSVKEQLEYIKH